MKAGSAVATLALSFMFLSSAITATAVPDPGIPQFANHMLNGFSTPTVFPGSKLAFSFNLTNPYAESTDIMENIILTIGVYKYSTQETNRVVDESFDDAPIIDHVGTEVVKEYDTLDLGETARVDLDISTTKDTPHGSYFSHSTYFMRFKVAFNFSGDSTPVVLQSRGFFTDEQWDQMVIFTASDSIINTTYMRSLGVDGLLPDSAFGLKKPIPVWPLGLLIAGICAVSFMSLFYFVLDNPGKYPRLEQRFYYLRGKLRELRSQFKDRRGK